jgi:hypothetical protein
MKTITIAGLIVALALMAPAAKQQYFAKDGESGVIGETDVFDFNAVNERAVAISAARYIVRSVAFTNCTNVDNASAIVGGVFTGAGGTGTQIGNFLGCIIDSTFPPNDPDLVHGCGSTTFGTEPDGQGRAFSAGTLYLRVTTPRGAAMTCDVVVIGDTLP